MLLKRSAGCVGLWLAATSVAQAQVFISEYVEGSGVNKALEIVNTSDVEVDLAAQNYTVAVYFNGGDSAGATLSLTGVIAPGETWVVGDDGADAELLALIDQTVTANLWNGDDAIVLMQDAVVIDSLGQVGFDPGSAWNDGTVTFQNATVRRLSAPDTNPADEFVPSAQWEGFASNTFDDVGLYNGDGGNSGGGNNGGGNNGGGNNGGGEEPPVSACGEAVISIAAIQGNGDSSPLDGQVVSVEAIVVGDFQGGDQLNGFFLQQADAEADADPMTSEGILVFEGSNSVDVQMGDRVRVTGTVDEFFDLTELTSVTSVEVCSSGNPLPTPATLSLPVADLSAFEAVEGMSVQFSADLTVVEHFNLDRYGQFRAANGRRFQPTQQVLPGAAAQAQQAANDLNVILVDDGSNVQNPETVIFPTGGLSADNAMRVGDSVSGLHGVIDYSFGNYRLIPTQAATFNFDNQRPLAPELAYTGRLQVASLNVLNYFNGDGFGGGFPTDRGAETQEEFTRQRDKLLAALEGIDADLVALVELENDGFGAQSAIADLVNGLNERMAEADEYAYVDAGVSQIGDDAIAVGFIYRPAKLTATGAAAILSTANSPLDDNNEPLFVDDKNRPALAQTFTEVATGESFTAVSNHFKSKGSDCDELGDPDQGDGQGNCNLTRTRAAQALATWLATDPTNSGDSDVLILGDLNAYAMEDPIRALEASGYQDLVRELNDGPVYSYLFDGQNGTLDYALANASLAEQISAATVWHINADEPDALDYNMSFRSDAQHLAWYADNAYRSSDHDPIILSLDLAGEAGEAPTASFVALQLWRIAVGISLSTDVDGELVEQLWNWGDNSESSGSFSLHFYAGAGDYDVSLTVTDDSGLSDSLVRSITVQ